MLTKDTRLLSVADAAKVLGVSRWTVLRLIESDQLGAYRVGRVYRVPLFELERLRTKDDAHADH